MTITGDFGQLERMTERLSELAEVPSRTARKVSASIESLMREEFDHGTDPYEESWAPLAPATVAKGRGSPPLTDSSAMCGTLRVAPLSGAGIGITIAHPAGVHQVGWTGPRSSGPARPILPARGELPDGWIEAIEAEAERTFKGVMRQ